MAMADWAENGPKESKETRYQKGLTASLTQRTMMKDTEAESGLLKRNEPEKVTEIRKRK